jgi:hypothetical protein
MVLPAIVFSTLAFHKVAIYPVTGYLQKISAFITNLVREALSRQVALIGGLPGGVLYPLNALDPALVIGATPILLRFKRMTLLAKPKGNTVRIKVHRVQKNIKKQGAPLQEPY